MDKDKDSVVLPSKRDAHTKVTEKGKANLVGARASRQHAIEHYWVNQQNAYPSYFCTSAAVPEEGPKRGTHEVVFPEELNALFWEKAKGRSFNLYKLALTTLYVLLHQYSRRHDLLVASTALFLDTPPTQHPAMLLPRLSLDEQGSVRDLLKQLHRELEQNMSHQDYDYTQFLKRYPAGRHYAPAPLEWAFFFAPVNASHPQLKNAVVSLELLYEAAVFKLHINWDTERLSLSF
ncbi:MAG: hypothetical protein AAGD05_07385, partial [Bacteroidota bacterium]